MKKFLLTAILAAGLTNLSYGAGFALYEFSGRSTAMGGAVMANGAEPASLATNPALITGLEGTQAQLGVTIVSANAKTSIKNPMTGKFETRELKRDIWTLPNFYITHKWSDEVSFGLGGFSRFGLGGTYKNYMNWYGSKLAYKVKLETFSFTPTIALKANDQLSLAMGLEAMTIDTSTGGVLKDPYAREIVRDSDAKGSITLPDSFSIGIAFRPDEKWTMELGAIATMWSSYDQITIEYKDDEKAPTIHNRKEYKDTIRTNFGVEYQFIPKWFARAGYVYDKSPINEHAMDTLVPVDDRHIASLGLGYKGETWSADIAYAHIFGRHLKGDSNAQFGHVPMRYGTGGGDMFALTIGYKF